MSDPTIFALFRTVLSALLAAGGVVCIIYGYRLFASGAGLAKGIEKMNLKKGEVKISAAGMSVGGVLMLTSAAWGFFAYSSVPKLKMAGSNIEIVEGAPPAPGSLTFDPRQRALRRVLGSFF